MNLKKQIRRLIALECVGYFRPAGCVWVLLLAGRGFTLAEIGLAEGFFHLVSLCCEIPSGMLADLLGRKKALAAGQIMSGLSAIAMIFSQNLAGVCLNMALCALGYNLASGTREAMTYDSLVLCGAEGEYLKVSSRQNTLYRLTTAVAMLCAGGTVLLGYRAAYLIDVGFSLAAVSIALSLWEPMVTEGQKNRERARLSQLPSRFKKCAADALHFLRINPKAMWLMLFNALVGASATLLGFFLQNGLSTAGAPAACLGPLLVGIGLGGAVGSHLAPLLEKLPYGASCVITTLGVAVGFLAAASGNVSLMALGGFLAAAGDDALQTLTDARLNAGIPSDQRATLVSVSSMCFSLVMVVLSPLAGIMVG